MSVGVIGAQRRETVGLDQFAMPVFDPLFKHDLPALFRFCLD